MTEITHATERSSWHPTGSLAAIPVNPRRLSVWMLAVLLTVYLGLSGGGYDIVVRSEIGLVVWWMLLLGVALGALPYARVPRAGVIAIALLAGFLIWTWIGLAWSSSHELTLDEVCRLSTYLGFLLIALCILTPETARSLVNGLGCGIAAVCAAAVMSKLTPSLFPAGAAGNAFYRTARLGYPFNYADGVGEYAALGLPLVFYITTSARTLLGRALGAGAIQAVLLCLAMTVSRGGILAAIVGMVAFIALVPNRIPRLVAAAIAATGIAVLMLALLHRSALRDSLYSAPAGERHSMLLIFWGVVLAAAAAQFGAEALMRRGTRPSWLCISRRGARFVTLAILTAVVIVMIVGFASGAIGRLWHDFKLWQPRTTANEYFRLFSLAGSHRYQYWQIAWKAFTGSPLHGIGSGTFQFYWLQHSPNVEKIVNAHSLWFETLAETGIVGWLLLAGFFGLVMIRGAICAIRNSAESHRTLTATAVAGVFAFCAAASFDWTWQIGVIPMVTMLLAATTFVSTENPCGERRPWLSVRLLLLPIAVLAMILIAIPLTSTVEVRASQAAFSRNDLRQALADANTAQAIEPGAASPYLQQALVLEQANDTDGALQAIRRATAAEPNAYLIWLTADRIETEANHPRQALAAYERALALFPSIPTQVG